MAGKRPLKIADLMGAIGAALNEGWWVDSCHALNRQAERRITRPEVVYVLRNGRHESRKDQFDEMHHGWNYAVRGKTVDGRELRIIVAFEEDEGGPLLVIVTAIDLAN